MAGDLSMPYLARSSTSSTKFFSTTVILSLSRATSSSTCLATRPLSDAADGLREEQQRDRLVDRGQMLREDLLVLRGEEGHPSIVRPVDGSSRLRT